MKPKAKTDIASQLAALGVKPDQCTNDGKPLVAALENQSSVSERVAKLGGFDSKAEADFAWELEILQRAGVVKWWRYDPIKGGLRLSEVDPQTKRCRSYRPDFLVEWNSGYVEFIEIKGGHIWEDAEKTFDWARASFPCWRFRMVQKIDGAWKTIRGDSNPEH